jgi:hypothetical protein
VVVGRGEGRKNRRPTVMRNGDADRLRDPAQSRR